MKVAEEKAGSVAAQKEKIRERYKGIDSDMLDVIPAIPPEVFMQEYQRRILDRLHPTSYKRIIMKMWLSVMITGY